ncbi:hypothetical protein E2L00_12385 [Cedecea colo]|uniref:Uncharacterized protein n=1 Tax=Cedecea colo TaxID=2552946 RepID=A0ABX0VPR6_9ENTR|nr:hypothetical protein [Cedecea colo]
MPYTNNPVIKHKASLPNLAEELSNVSKGWRPSNISSMRHWPGWHRLFVPARIWFTHQQKPPVSRDGAPVSAISRL